MDTKTEILRSEYRENQTKEEKSAQREWLLEAQKNLGLQIMENCRNALYSRHPYLDGALAALPVVMGEETETIATDGRKLYVSPAFLLSLYAKTPELLQRGYLHILFHCLYFHFLPAQNCGKMTAEKQKRWNLACDMAVEWMLENAAEESQVLQIEEEYTLEVETNEKKKFREECFSILRVKGNSGISAEQIMHWLEEGIFPVAEEQLFEVFAFDSHKLWEKEWHSGLQGVRRKWEELMLRFGGKQGVLGQAGSMVGAQRERMEMPKQGKYDYRKFLKRFAIRREEAELDMESFDYIPYDLGMRLFGNIPMIEPLEYKEVHRLEELVIAIDTSNSCSREIVQQFLNETYSILNEKENFFRKFKIYLIQCDCFLQEVVVLQNEEEWKAYIKKVQIQGRSGTDFRPVFRYVEELRRKRELQNLKALIYFTDGDGIYPEKPTEYETAFVFLKKNEHMQKVPKWARKLVAEEKRREA